MKTILLILSLALVTMGCVTCPPICSDNPRPTAPCAIFAFQQDADLSGWEIQDDVVMGGLSQGTFGINAAGNAVFSGTVSLENNGGFSSVQYTFPLVDVSAYRTVVLGLIGDGQRYQLRLESSADASHSYACDFQTSGIWQTIELPFAEFHAIHHGDRLDLPNYPGQTLARIQLLAIPDTAGPFRLEIDRIWLK